MQESSLSKIEKIHLGTQTLAQATTIIAAIVVAVWGYYSTVYVNKVKEVTEYTLKDLNQKTTQNPIFRQRSSLRFSHSWTGRTCFKLG